MEGVHMEGVQMEAAHMEGVHMDARGCVARSREVGRLGRWLRPWRRKPSAEPGNDHAPGRAAAE